MPEAKTYTPRKVTPQNEDTLPSTHDESAKTSYIQITLKEETMAEAIRNYIGGLMPIQPGDEMPVQFMAGRGDNGHTTTVTILAGPVITEQVTTPSDFVPEFAEAQAAAAARNASNNEGAELPPPVVPISDEERIASEKAAAEAAQLDVAIKEGQAADKLANPDLTNPVIENAPIYTAIEGTESTVSTTESPFVDDNDVVENEEEPPVSEVEAVKSTLFPDVVDERDEPTLEEQAEDAGSSNTGPVAKKTVSDLFGPKPTTPEPAAAAKAATPAPKPKSDNIFDNLG